MLEAPSPAVNQPATAAEAVLNGLDLTLKPGEPAPGGGPQRLG